MGTTREKIDNFSKTLDTYIINFSSDFKIISNNTTSIQTLTKLKTALDNYTMILKELITLESSERKDKKRLSLSCATVISQQADDTIVEYIETYWEKDGGKPYSYDVGDDSETEVISLIGEVLKVTNDMELVIRKYKWASM